MSLRAEQLEDMAWECRTLANAAVHGEVREPHSESCAGRFLLACLR
jgi:hypothetical protein